MVGFILINKIDDQKITDYKCLKQKEAWIKTIRDFVIGVVTWAGATGILDENWNIIVSCFQHLLR